MYHWKHLSSIDDAIDLQIRSIIILPLLNGLFIIIAINEPLYMGLIEPIEFILHILAEGVDLILGEPLSVKIAPSLVFDEILFLFSIISFSFP